jgi:hypothetical protein
MPFAVVFLLLRLGDKSLLKGRGLSAAHYQQTAMRKMRTRMSKPTRGPSVSQGRVRVCVGPSGVCEHWRYMCVSGTGARHG